MASDRKVVLITGAAKRIGKAIAEYCHGKGMQVLLHYHHSVDEATQLANLFNKQRTDSAAILRCDLRDLSALKTLSNAAIAKWGRVDVLINNAASFYPTEVDTASEEAWDDLFNINLKAPYFLVQQLLPTLKKSAGCIINIADIHGLRPMKNYSIYCVSKAGLLMLTQSLAKELAPSIRVNAIAPGPTIWPEHEENALNTEKKQKILERMPLKKFGSPVEIAKAVAFLIDADTITGQTITIDSGRSLIL